MGSQAARQRGSFGDDDAANAGHKVELENDRVRILRIRLTGREIRNPRPFGNDWNFSRRRQFLLYLSRPQVPRQPVSGKHAWMSCSHLKQLPDRAGVRSHRESL
jgi:hypothetical protein